MELICERCGYVGKPKRMIKGTFWMEVLLWLCFLLPGMIYSIWRLTTKYDGCPKCKAPMAIPVDSPRGRKLLEEFGK